LKDEDYSVWGNEMKSEDYNIWDNEMRRCNEIRILRVIEYIE
jgi:hypothetical protein